MNAFNLKKQQEKQSRCSHIATFVSMSLWRSALNNKGNVKQSEAGSAGIIGLWVSLTGFAVKWKWRKVSYQSIESVAYGFSTSTLETHMTSVFY